MPQVARRAKPNFDANSVMYDPRPLIAPAGEDVEVGPGYIGTDGLAYASNGTAANAAATCDGFFVQSHKKGEPTVLHSAGTRIGYGDGTLQPNALLYVDTVKGRLNTAATTGGTVPVAKVIGNTQDIRVIRDY